jgi:soluble lytic murein transglycosylase
MKLPRLLALALAASLIACSLSPALPANPFGPTSTPSATLTPIATLTPTPSPTPVPLMRVESGDQARFNGDYAAARAEYQQAYDGSTDPEVRAAALWGLARVEFEAHNLEGAATRLSQLISEAPESVHAAQAYFLRGKVNYALGKYAEAAADFQSYLSQRPGLIDAYALEYQGDAYFDAGNYAEALAAYTAATLAPRLDAGLELQIQIGKTYAALGQYGNAIALYDAIFASSNNDYVKAQLDYLTGSAYLSLGQTEEAYARFKHAVENYPLSIHAYNCLVELVNANVQVSELDRGIVDYYAAQQGAAGYDVALAALDRYLAAGLDSDGTARFYRALTLEALDRDEEAIQDYTTVINSYANNPHWSEAWANKATLQWQTLGDYSAAAQTLREFASRVPTDPEADDFLMDAARLLERDNQLHEAALVWESVVDQYPGGDRAHDAIFLAGITHYRLGDYGRAEFDFQRGFDNATTPENQSRALLWVGKTQEKQGDSQQAFETWTRAQSIDPTGYYSERARDLLIGAPPFAPATLVKLDYDLAAERVEAAAWLRVTFNLPPETDLSGPGPLAGDARFVRGTELWELGQYDEARVEFEALRNSVSASPADTFRLANYLIDNGLYYQGINATRQVLTLAGLISHADSLKSPMYFKHVRYGLYYRDLIEPAAQENGIDTLLLFSVVRQESLFDGFAISYKGAGGLMQIMPDTGAEIARELGWPPLFETHMLYQPNVSVRFGAHYLASNRDKLGGDIYVMLAAYNGGPYGASIWQSLAPDDPDLFVEVVRPAETRDFIRGIYEIYKIYLGIYSPVQE